MSEGKTIKTSELTRRAKEIINRINRETEGLEPNERAMVCLFICKLVECTVEADIVDTLRMPGEGQE